MTKRYAILQKKLHELESELNEAFSLPTDIPICNQNFCQDIDQKFVFLANLLSAEVASHPSKPHHLQHIARRLAELDAAFRDWEGHKMTTALDNIEMASTCSCTESCLNDDGEASNDLGGSGGFVDPENVSEGLIDEKTEASGVEEPDKFFESQIEEETLPLPVETSRVARVGDVVKRGWVLGTFCWGMAGGMVVGAALMGYVMVNLFDCFSYVRHNSCLLPT